MSGLAEAYRALGDEASAAAEVAAEATYERLGSYRPARELPDGLTRREYEVLTLVADGRSNRTDRRGALHQRPHGRPAPDKHLHQDRCHLPTQAARYAIDRGMTGTR